MSLTQLTQQKTKTKDSSLTEQSNLCAGYRAEGWELLSQTFIINSIIEVLHVQVDTLKMTNEGWCKSPPGWKHVTIPFTDLSAAHIYPQNPWRINVRPMNYRITVAAILAGVTYEGGNTEFDKAADFQDIWPERRQHSPGSESFGLVSFAQICAWVLSAAPLSSVHGQHRWACRSAPSHSSHLLPANK